MTEFEKLRITSALSALYEVCRKHSCEDCPLGNADMFSQKSTCVFKELKNIWEVNHA